MLKVLPYLICLSFFSGCLYQKPPADALPIENTAPKPPLPKDDYEAVRDLLTPKEAEMPPVIPGSEKMPINSSFAH